MIDKSKTYRTRDGREVRIYATDGAGIMPVHGAVKENGGWYRASWCLNGGVGGNMQFPDDLIEVRPRHKRTVWVHVWENGTVYATEEKYYVRAGRIACIKVELDFEEGEGL